MLSTLHTFIATTACISLSPLVPYTSPSPLHTTLIAGLEVLPYTELDAALLDCLRSAERPSYHADLMGQSGFCGNVTCLALVLVKTWREGEHAGFRGSKEVESEGKFDALMSYNKTTINKHSHSSSVSTQPNQGLSSILQIINLYGSHRLLPSFFTPLAVALFAHLNSTQVQGLKLCLDTQEQLNNTEYATWTWDMLVFVLQLDGVCDRVLSKCAMLVVQKMKEQSGGRALEHPGVGVKVLKILSDQGKICDHISVISELVASCTDKKVVDSIVSELSTTVMLDVAHYSDTLSILTSISTVHGLLSNTRTLVAVIQCVLCGSGDLTASLQYLYVQYVVNPVQMTEMFANRCDLIACLSSHVKTTSPHLDVALLLLLKNLTHLPDSAADIHLDIDSVSSIIQETPSPLTLTLVWKVVQFNLLCDFTHGLSYLAISSIVESDHVISLSAAVFVLARGDPTLPWFNVLLQTSLLLDELPSGVMWLLANQDKSRLRETTYQRIKHLLKCLELQFEMSVHTTSVNESPYEQQAVIMNLLLQLYELYPEPVTKSISKCVLEERQDSGSDWVRKGKLVYHTSSFSIIGKTKESEIRKDYLKMKECASCC